jgi:hypothetical protein
MHNLDTTLNFDIKQPGNSHAFFRGEFTTFQTSTKLIQDPPKECIRTLTKENSMLYN